MASTPIRRVDQALGDEPEPGEPVQSSCCSTARRASVRARSRWTEAGRRTRSIWPPRERVPWSSSRRRALGSLIGSSRRQAAPSRPAGRAPCRRGCSTVRVQASVSRTVSASRAACRPVPSALAGSPAISQHVGVVTAPQRKRALGQPGGDAPPRRPRSAWSRRRHGAAIASSCCCQVKTAVPGSPRGRRRSARSRAATPSRRAMSRTSITWAGRVLRARAPAPRRLGRSGRPTTGTARCSRPAPRRTSAGPARCPARAGRPPPARRAPSARRTSRR